MIPFYLPKPLLVISKNFYQVEEAKVGLTHSAPVPDHFDNQAAYADVNARASFVGPPSRQDVAGGTRRDEQFANAPANGAPVLHSSSQTGIPVTPLAQDLPDDGLTPKTFFTYRIVFVPDLSQKYGLQIRGGPGEIRAALNLVNGWQFTGLGPYYLKDSSTTQNILSAGIATNLALTGAGDVVSSLADLRQIAGAGTGVDPAAIRRLEQSIRNAQDRAAAVDNLPKKSGFIRDYAIIHVFEPYVTPDGQMEWREITTGKSHFDRFYLGADGKDSAEVMPPLHEPPGEIILPPMAPPVDQLLPPIKGHLEPYPEGAEEILPGEVIVQDPAVGQS